jgi:hypothetical protein
MFQHPLDWHNNTGVFRQAEEQGIGIITIGMSVEEEAGILTPQNLLVRTASQSGGSSSGS